ncbi:MAG: molybdate ABC transporter permease subunit [Magnetococcales bacterium]|nr:molybdate ABC transporter permease subunit [Magnetococcales bacterium]
MLWQPVILSLKLATATTIILLIVCWPLAWWLATTDNRYKSVVAAITALPLVLPPSVLGFYLLLLLSPNGPVGGIWDSLTGQGGLAFTFIGLLIASCIYSFPFVVQPLQAAMEKLDLNQVEAAWTLGASKRRTLWSVVLPQIRHGILSATILGFIHTLGEFGVVLMVGGNIPGQTQVISIAIYEQVELMDYHSAHILSGGLALSAFMVLFLVYTMLGQSAGQTKWRRSSP